MRSSRAAILVVVLVAIVVALGSWLPWLAVRARVEGEILLLRAAGHALNAAGTPPARVDAVAVHGGGGVDSARERPAVAMLSEGRAGVIVAMGGPLPAGDPDLTYANAVARRLRGLGVAETDIVRLSVGQSTLGELRGLRRLAEERGWKDLALSTSQWHARRVSLAADRAFAGSNVRWTVVALPDPATDLDRWWQDERSHAVVVGEWLKIALLLALESD